MIRLKTTKDIEGIRIASKILSRVLASLVDMVEPGISTRDLDHSAIQLIKDSGASPSFKGYYDYPTALCTSINDEVIHGIPSRRALKEGDILGIDCGISFEGYFSDTAVTVPVGTVDPKVREFLSITEESLYLGIKAGAVGKKIKDISRAIYTYLHAHRFGVVRSFSGHGVGFAVHEEPSVPNYITKDRNIMIQEGLVIAIEPMATMKKADVRQRSDGWTVETVDGSWAAHFEHTVAFAQGKAEILTAIV